jgi:hypothetical protein
VLGIEFHRFGFVDVTRAKPRVREPGMFLPGRRGASSAGLWLLSARAVVRPTCRGRWTTRNEGATARR